MAPFKVESCTLGVLFLVRSRLPDMIEHHYIYPCLHRFKPQPELLLDRCIHRRIE
jgi:hypothetical protein